MYWYGRPGYPTWPTRKPNPNPNDKVNHVAHVADRHTTLKSKVDRISETNPRLRVI